MKSLRNAEAEIERGDKIALIGANGKGKSTVLRIVAGTESFTGDRIWGHHVDASFYAQHQLESLNLNDTVLEEMKHCGSRKMNWNSGLCWDVFFFPVMMLKRRLKY